MYILNGMKMRRGSLYGTTCTWPIPSCPYIHICIYTYIYAYTYICAYIHTYVYSKWLDDEEKESWNDVHMALPLLTIYASIDIYMYIYILGGKNMRRRSHGTTCTWPIPF